MPALDDATTRPQPPGFGGKPGGPFAGKAPAAIPQDAFAVASLSIGPGATGSIAIGPGAMGTIRINEAEA